jgi:HPt (histidine-containing phosphotransfer) domain-containing protein
MKSAARTVGALQLGDLCEQLEDAERAGDAALCRTIGERVSAAYIAAADRIEKALAGKSQS